MMLLLVGLASAAGVHAGIPVNGVAGLGTPAFLTAATGWTAPVAGGWVRVYVGATEAEAQDWYARTLESIGRTPERIALAGVDEAHGDGATLVAFREGNVGVLVRVERDAGAVAARLRDSIVASGPHVVATLRGHPDLGDYAFWEVDAPGAAAIRSARGGAVGRDAVRFTEKPDEVYVWDAYGRVTVLRP